jgi:membrane associated rhomboid family serine protease
MIPIRDDNPTRKRQYVTVALIVAMVLIYLYTDSLNRWGRAMVMLGFGAIPAVLSGDSQLAYSLRYLPKILTPITSLFLHTDIFHIGGNALFLWIFGSRVEGVMGHGRYLLFFLLCGIGGVALQIYATPGLQVPIVGSSSAIAGILGAYLLLFPYARVLVWLPPFWPPFRAPALIYIGLWIAYQFSNSLVSDPHLGGTGYLVHVGGFLAGLALLPLLKERDVRLWQPPQPWPPPAAAEGAPSADGAAPVATVGEGAPLASPLPPGSAPVAEGAIEAQGHTGPHTGPHPRPGAEDQPPPG